MIELSVQICAFICLSKLLKGLQLHVNTMRSTGLSRYQEMINYPGVHQLANTTLVLEPSIKLLKNYAIKFPQSSSYVPACCYLYHLSPVVVVCTSLDLNNDRITWKRAQFIKTGGRKCAHYLSFVSFVSSLACIFDVGGIENLSEGIHRVQVRNIY